MTTQLHLDAVSTPDYHAVPGPRGLPFLGVALRLLSDPFTLIERASLDHGGIARLRIPMRPGFLLSSPELVQFALVETERAVRKPPAIIKRVFPALGLGLVTSEGSLWKRNRRLVNPIFSKARMNSLEPSIQAAASATITRWSERRVIDIKHEMGRTMLDLVLKGLFSAAPVAMSRFDQLTESLQELMRYTARVFVSAIPLDTYLPTPARLRAEFHRRRVDRIIQEMVDARRASGEVHDDLLGMLMQATDSETGEGLSDTELADEVRTMFLAGYETTATALLFAFTMVSQHPHVRERLEEELDRVLGGRMPTIADVKALSYTMMVFHETMRLYPPAWMIMRELPAETEVGGYRLPKGAFLFVSPWATHRNPEVWPSPLTFDPERFSAENRRNIHRFAFVPFGGGVRKCVGTNLAMLEGPMLLAALAQRFRLDTMPGERLDVRGGLTLSVEGGTRMLVTPRRRALSAS